MRVAQQQRACGGGEEGTDGVYKKCVGNKIKKNE